MVFFIRLSLVYCASWSLHYPSRNFSRNKEDSICSWNLDSYLFMFSDTDDKQDKISNLNHKNTKQIVKSEGSKEPDLHWPTKVSHIQWLTL